MAAELSSRHCTSGICHGPLPQFFGNECDVAADVPIRGHGTCPRLSARFECRPHVDADSSACRMLCCCRARSESRRKLEKPIGSQRIAAYPQFRPGAPNFIDMNRGNPMYHRRWPRIPRFGRARPYALRRIGISVGGSALGDVVRPRMSRFGWACPYALRRIGNPVDHSATADAIRPRAHRGRPC